ncbi:sensor histidine kinase, partial [Desulfonatronospira sp.]|uniref:sensor histidine kinase n=1 Tax=Desulfonatronospira sp. TaxID=1962951 RepID=UPI0025B7CFD3
MKAPGFHFRLLVAAFLLIAGPVFLMGYLGLGMMRGYVQDRFHERNQLLSGNLARNAELGLLINDERMLAGLGSSLMSEPDVVGVRISDSSGKSLFASIEDHPGEYTVATDMVRTREVDEDSVQGLHLFSMEDGERIIGEVEVYFSLQEIHGLQGSLLRTFGVLSLVVALLSILFFYIISRSLVNPVNELAGVASRIAGGDRKIRARPDNIPETRELALAFNSMLDSLDKSRKELEQAYQDMARQKTMAELGKFAMLIAHEVKNPLSIIKSSLDVLKDEASIGHDHPMVHFIDDEIRRISRLLEDFLTFARPAEPVREDVDLNQLVEESVQRFEIQQESGDIKIVLDLPDTGIEVSADRDLIAKAVYNLLKNSAEANEWQGRINLRTGLENSRWFIEVEDQGPGVPLSMEDKIFEPFFTTKTRGSGLGLAFVVYVAEMHGGSVQAANNSDLGAVFR